MTDTEMKTYILTLRNGNLRKVTVPATWKTTFGPTVPFERKGGGFNSGESWALRFYEGAKENLRAIFTDVASFYDESIEIMERVTSTQRKVTQRATRQGMKDVLVEARVTEWKRPDGDDDDGELNPFLLEAGETED